MEVGCVMLMKVIHECFTITLGLRGILGLKLTNQSGTDKSYSCNNGED